MSFPTFTNSGFPSFGTNPFNPVLGPPKGLFSNNPIGTPRGFSFGNAIGTPRGISVRPFMATSLINAMPKTNDGVAVIPKPTVITNNLASLINSIQKPQDGVAVIPKPNMSVPPRTIDPNNIFVKPANVLTNPVQNLNAMQPMVNNSSNIKVASFSTTITDELGAPIANANLYLDDVAVGLTDANGYVSKIGFNPLSRVKISFVGFQPFEGLASQVPAKVVLTTGIPLDGVTIANTKSKKTPWLMIILGAAVAYGGYKYFFDKKSNSVVKVKL
ncbi:MAG: carboxypeptidase regulatory-like domain-containing protein [Methylotenera sp.]|nr:carboxypeptidase regulatory-like domain-containing protein [Flavobacterium sp.]